MYLSRTAIDLKNRNTMRAMENPEIMHGIIENCFQGERRRNLWRIDEIKGQIYILLLSTEKPDMDVLVKQIGLTGGEWDTRDYTPLLERVKQGSIWRFHLAVNPVVNVPEPNNGRGKVKAITIPAHQREWLKQQGSKHGFLLADDQFDVIRSEWKIFRNKGKNVSIFRSTFEGILTVSNQEEFVKALIGGIGRGKAYGNGMITVMHCRE
ncbi:MAG: type I-E CRISPR-associated protein Cas6/Cse3/CasE [Clostridia bacterium]|nr:type I-E CRISPR-associated protein Cas6/Cse3/CasE [Clostridia bacterium]